MCFMSVEFGSHTGCIVAYLPLSGGLLRRLVE